MELTMTKLERFLAKPPKRISETAVNQRRVKNLRKGKPKSRLVQLCQEQNNRCYYCGKGMRGNSTRRPADEATLEHLTPLSRGGDNRKANTVAACFGCNTAKGNMTEAEYVAAIAKDTP